MKLNFQPKPQAHIINFKMELGLAEDILTQYEEIQKAIKAGR